MGSRDLTLVATYRRTVRASLERIWENVLDWEHLPWLHRRSFLGIRLLEQTADGWRARVTLPPASAPRAVVIAVQLDQPRLRYWSRTLEGQGAGTDILTRLQPLDERATGIEAEFWAPVANAEQAESVGAAFLRLYTRLWDEDEAMMVRRQTLLDARRISKTPGVLRKRERRAP
ncbi:MAG: hypothetical protein AB1671_08565 [Thermodesulfobacteriota bacterium]|jgi:hypothetical protein